MPKEYYDSEYFAVIYKPDEFLVANEDDYNSDDSPQSIIDKSNIRLQKFTKNLANLHAILAEINTPGFKAIEKSLMKRARHIEVFLIWNAIAAGDQPRIMDLHSEHGGIISFFQTYSKVTEHAENCKSELKRAALILDREAGTYDDVCQIDKELGIEIKR